MPYQFRRCGGNQTVNQYDESRWPNKGDIVLLADDLDDREREAISTQLKGEHWRLVILGIGSKAGAPIPLEDGSLMTKDNGQPVVAKSNFDNMHAVTKEVNGYFVPLQVTNRDVESIGLWTQHIDLTSSIKGGQSISERINQGYYLIPLLLPALMLFRRGFIFGLVMMSLSYLYTTGASQSFLIKLSKQTSFIRKKTMVMQLKCLMTNSGEALLSIKPTTLRLP